MVMVAVTVMMVMVREVNTSSMDIEDEHEIEASKMGKIENELRNFGMILQSYSQMLILFQTSNTKYRSPKSKSFSAPSKCAQITLQSLLFLLKLLQTTPPSSTLIDGDGQIK
jgi:hypothetical protein